MTSSPHELQDQRSVSTLIHLMPTPYPLSIPNALVRIGGPAVESEAAKLLTHASLDARANAIDVLYRLQGARMLPLLRRMIVEKDFGVKGHAVRLIAKVGDREDLKWLLPMADFWTGDRANHLEARMAVAEIRERYQADR